MFNPLRGSALASMLKITVANAEINTSACLIVSLFIYSLLRLFHSLFTDSLIIVAVFENLYIRKKLGSGFFVVFESAQHLAGLHAGVGFLHTAHHRTHMHALTTTATPCGSKVFWMKSAIWVVICSWICKRRANISTMRGILLKPTTFPFGM